MVASRLSWAIAGRKLDAIGVQLYTVRNAMKTDFPGTIAKVAQIGYKKSSSQDISTTLQKKFGPYLTKITCRRPPRTFPTTCLMTNGRECLEAAQVVGHKYIVCPWIDDEVRKQGRWKEAAAKFNKAAEASKKGGDSICISQSSLRVCASRRKVCV